MKRRQAGLIAVLILLLFPGCGREGAPAGGVRTGLEVLAGQGFAPLRGKRVGVITNPTGVDRGLNALPDLLSAAPGVTLAAIFAPEHGFRGAAAAGEKVADATDPRTGAPVYSLYGASLRPGAAALAAVDVVVFDIQDVGVRAYTYLSTLKEAMIACAAAGKEVWVLDRPAPLGGEVAEGPVLEAGRESFVGAHRLPLRHGLTAGEFARLVNEEAAIGAALHVVPLTGWRRGMLHEETGLLWVPPSPNIPTADTALVYAGMVLIEGTNLSEGRGTARPFHLVGAPWLAADALARELGALRLPGCLFRPQAFMPTASKFEGSECQGIEVHVTDRRTFRPVTAAVALLSLVRRLHPGDFRFQAETFDRLAGTARLREALEAGTGHAEIIAAWQPDLAAHEARRRKFLLYP